MAIFVDAREEEGADETASEEKSKIPTHTHAIAQKETYTVHTHYT